MAVQIYLNELSGSIPQYERNHLLENFRAIMGEDLDCIEILPPDQLFPALEKIDPSHKILIGGGDGTIRSAASIFMRHQVGFGILPFGTMNLFAKDLSLPMDPFEAARLYKDFTTIALDCGEVNGEIFLCNAMVGIPCEIAEEREAVRHNETIGKWLQLVQHGFARLTGRKAYPMRLEYDGRKEYHNIKAIIIGNNEYETAGGPGTFKKKSLKDGLLSIYTVNTEGPLEAMELLSKLAIGSWHEAHGLNAFNTTALKVKLYQKNTTILLDGEAQRFSSPLRFKIRPQALQINVPCDLMKGD